MESLDLDPPPKASSRRNVKDELELVKSITSMKITAHFANFDNDKPIRQQNIPIAFTVIFQKISYQG